MSLFQSMQQKDAGMFSAFSQKIAIIGARGRLGRIVLSVLKEKDYPQDSILAFDSRQSVGLPLPYGNEYISCVCVDSIDFRTVDIVLFLEEPSFARLYMERALQAGCFVIDNTGESLKNPDALTIVTEINKKSIFESKKQLIMTPSCSTLQTLLALHPLHEIFKIKHILATSYEPASGEGEESLDALQRESFQKLIDETYVPECHHVGFNIVPHIGHFLANGYTDQEERIRNEIKKILDPDIEVSLTCVKVPVFVGQCVCVTVQFEKTIDIEQVMHSFSTNTSLVYMCLESTPEAPLCYMTPAEVEGKNPIYVGRLRIDTALPNALSFWVVADNLRRCISMNIVQILDTIVSNNRCQKAA